MSKVTLATIATQTGLSKFAVSRALSGKSGVSSQTRARVRQVAAELGYERTPGEADAPTLAVIFHDMDLINSELHLLIQSGVQLEAQKLGYRVAMHWTHLVDEVEAIVRSHRGAVMVGPFDRATYLRAYGVGHPIVRTGWLDPLEQADHVSGTDHEAGAAVAAHLVGLGHRTIAYVHGTPGFRGRAERFYGVREVLERRPGVSYREMKFEAEVRFTEHLLAAQADGFHPTAFFCAHDGLALTVVSELLRLGYRIPEDASVIGFGDFSAATHITPQLTTVRVPGQEIGMNCVRLLHDRLSGRIPRSQSLRVLIANRIVERASCGPAPVLAPPARLRVAG